MSTVHFAPKPRRHTTLPVLEPGGCPPHTQFDSQAQWATSHAAGLALGLLSRGCRNRLNRLVRDRYSVGHSPGAGGSKRVCGGVGGFPLLQVIRRSLMLSDEPCSSSSNPRRTNLGTPVALQPLALPRQRLRLGRRQLSACAPSVIAPRDEMSVCWKGTVRQPPIRVSLRDVHGRRGTVRVCVELGDSRSRCGSPSD